MNKTITHISDDLYSVEDHDWIFYYKLVPDSILLENSLEYVYIVRSSKTGFNYISITRGRGLSREDCLGLAHRMDGPACHNKKNSKQHSGYAFDGVFYDTREEWFTPLSVEAKRLAVWKLDDF